MGINNLLRALESIQIPRHLSYYRNKKIAVDGYCWLHKSIYLLTNEIFENPHSTKYLKYLNKRLEQLLHFEITPIIVFDGDKLPMKKIEEEERQRHRSEVTIQSLNLRRNGLEKLAQSKRIEGIDINPKMAYEFIKILKQKKIEYFVAPYEADIQLCYLSKIGYVDCVITEDSDLLALGCERILYKLDADSGIGKEIELKNLKYCKEYDFSSFDNDKFLTFCILSGCDYFKLKGVGIKNAYNTVKNSNSYKKCILSVSSKIIEEPDEINEIIEKFEKAFLTFRYQVVYCPLIHKLKYFDDIYKSKYKFTKKYMDDLRFLGNININNDLVQKIVYGEIDPITYLPFEYNPQIYDKKNKNNNFGNNHFLNKKRILKKEEDDDEFNLDINLDIRNMEEENEKSINPQISTVVSSPDLKKNIINNEPIVISDSSSNQNEKDNNSVDEINGFDDFLTSFDKTDKKLKLNTSKENIEKIKIEYNENVVNLINIDDLNEIKEVKKEKNKKDDYLEQYKFNPEEYTIGNI